MLMLHFSSVDYALSWFIKKKLQFSLSRLVIFEKFLEQILDHPQYSLQHLPIFCFNGLLYTFLSPLKLLDEWPKAPIVNSCILHILTHSCFDGVLLKSSISNSQHLVPNTQTNKLSTFMMWAVSEMLSVSQKYNVPSERKYNRKIKKTNKRAW